MKTLRRVLRVLLAIGLSRVEDWGPWLLARWRSASPAEVPEGVLRKRPREQRPQRPSRPNRYFVSSLFLHRCRERLTGSPCEDLHLVTGVIIDGQAVLSDLVELPNVCRSPTRASAAPLDVKEGLMVMEAFGAKALALFHSHPGRGAGSTCPSSIDWRNQRVWEQAFPLLGAVFTEDGFTRFFCSSGRPDVEVLGKKVRKLDVDLFKLEVEGDADPGMAMPESSGR